MHLGFEILVWFNRAIRKRNKNSNIYVSNLYTFVETLASIIIVAGAILANLRIICAAKAACLKGKKKGIVSQVCDI